MSAAHAPVINLAYLRLITSSLYCKMSQGAAMTDPTQITELDLVVGSLITTRPDEDRAAFEEEYETIAQVQDQLREEGVVVDLLSQPGAEMWEGGIETLGALYQLTRLAVHLEHGHDIATILEEGPVIYDDLDRAVTDVWDNLTTTRFPHLVNLQGINSYYLPVDFERPLWLPGEDEAGEEDDSYFGSSFQLQRELSEVVDLFRQAGIPTQSAAYRCLEVLCAAADQSLRYDLPVIIW
jgi:hypothetical protein